MYLQGFSDGASYALGLGRANGDLFRRVIAFSPGVVPRSDTADHGTPGIFISHGHSDAVLPFNRTATETVPALRQAGYVVEFIEFDGGHTVPVDVADQAFDWLLR